MRDDDLKEYIKSQEPMFLNEARKGYVCPNPYPSLCGNGSGPDGDGITRIKGSNNFHCFKCGMTADIFGLIGMKFNLPDFPSQMQRAKEIYGIVESDTDYTPAPLPPAKKTEPVFTEPEVDQALNYKKWNRAINEPGNPGLAYMQSRGLSLETLNRFNVGYASAWKHPKTAHLPKVPTSPRIIIPSSPFSYLARDIRDPKKLSDNQKKYTKSKYGRVRLFNQEILKTSDMVFIVEGEIDAMSIYEAGYDAVGLGSASNRLLFERYLQEHKSSADAVYVILPDNDTAGKTSAFALRDELKSAGINVLVANIFGKYKDANEMLVADRDALCRQLDRVARKAKAAPPDVTNKTCRALLSMPLLNLHGRHRSILHSKGLSDEMIGRFGYRSTPSQPQAVAKMLCRSGSTLKGIDFAKKEADGSWTLGFDGPGILVPVRDMKGQILGFEQHLDTGDVVPVDAPHFRRGERGIQQVVLTDTALSADIICALSGYSVIAMGGCSQKQLAGEIRTLMKRGLGKVRIALTSEEDIRKARELFHSTCTYCGCMVREDMKDRIIDGNCPRCGKPIGLPCSGFKLEPGMRLDEWLAKQKR